MVSSTNKTDLHDITEILLKVALNTIIQRLCEEKISGPPTKGRIHKSKQYQTFDSERERSIIGVRLIAPVA